MSKREEKEVPRRSIAMATHFDRELLAHLAPRERIRIEIQAGGRAHLSRLMFVIHHDHLYIRSARRDNAPWYQTLRANPQATLHVGRLHLPIRAVAVQDEQTRKRVGEHFVQKYVYLHPSSTRTMLYEQVAETTFRLEPAEVEMSV